MQSKAGQRLSRYFPELMTAFLALTFDSFILDGEIVIFSQETLSFEESSPTNLSRGIPHSQTGEGDAGHVHRFRHPL
jgi:hypothetical protein